MHFLVNGKYWNIWNAFHKNRITKLKIKNISVHAVISQNSFVANLYYLPPHWLCHEMKKIKDLYSFCRNTNIWLLDIEERMCNSIYSWIRILWMMKIWNGKNVILVHKTSNETVTHDRWFHNLKFNPYIFPLITNIKNRIQNNLNIDGLVVFQNTTCIFTICHEKETLFHNSILSLAMTNVKYNPISPQVNLKLFMNAITQKSFYGGYYVIILQ